MYKISKILLISTILISGFVYGIQSTNSSDTEYIEYRKQIVPGIQSGQFVALLLQKKTTVTN